MQRNVSEERVRQKPHCLSLEGREKLSLSGVEDVVSFNDTGALLKTSCGMLMVSGSGIKVHRLDMGDGMLTLTGEFSALKYDAAKAGRGGFFSKVLG